MANIEPLRPFQEEDVPFFLDHPKSLILYEPRLGKTVVACNVLALDQSTSSVLIACSKNAMSVWIDHIQAWFAHIRGRNTNEYIDFRIIRGKHANAKAQRLALWDKPRTAAITVYLVTFNALLFDYPHIEQKKMRFDSIIADEVHRVLRSKTNKSAKMFRALVKDARRFHALSGTLVSKWGPGDYWTLLNICNRREHGSYWAWMETFCHMVDGQFGRELVGIRNVDAFHRHMARYARVRKRKQCAPQMPEVQRDLLWLEMDAEQTKAYNEIGRSSITITEHGSVIVAANSLEKTVRKRQILTCPRIIDPKLGLGTAFNDFLEKIEEAKENEEEAGYHTVLFTSYRAAIPHWAEELKKRGYPTQILTGGTEPEELVAIIEEFRKSKGIILCTTQFAQAFSLEPATICYHIGWDYDPNNNKQAEDRLVPQQGVNPITSYYYAYRETDDEDIAHRVGIKQQMIQLTTDTTYQ